jgi:hypothetical protein
MPKMKAGIGIGKINNIILANGVYNIAPKITALTAPEAPRL